MMNLQITTRWADESNQKLRTKLEQQPVPELASHEVLVEMLAVPMHGSFWLASHPDGIHPRKDEFMMKGRFVFGNGGIGRVLKSTEDPRLVGEGDYVCVFGHVPCRHYDCYACTVLHRYIECDYRESTILGHGTDAHDGTYAKYAVLPKYSYEVCYRAEEKPSPDDVAAFMFGFLLADVRNALTRHPDSLRMRRMLLIGAGFSGVVAAYLHNRSCPESRIFVIDSSAERLENLKEVAPREVGTFLLSPDIARELNTRHQDIGFRNQLRSVVKQIADEMRKHFDGRGCNLLFDASSGNTAPLWDNEDVLSPGTHCIPFGFGSHYIILNKNLIQMSGLNIMMSRGVGNIRNRKEVIELIKAGAGGFLLERLVGTARRIDGFEAAAAFIEEMQNPPRQLHTIPPAYIATNPF